MSKYFSNAIKIITKMSDKEKIRYRNVVLKSSDLSELAELKKVIQQHFPDYATMEALSTELPISRIDFINELKKNRGTGLVICLPENYQVSWSVRDKQSLYSFLSMHSGEVPQIIVLCIDNPSFKTVNVNYFKLLNKVTIATTLLVSNRTDSNVVGI